MAEEKTSTVPQPSALDDLLSFVEDGIDDIPSLGSSKEDKTVGLYMNRSKDTVSRSNSTGSCTEVFVGSSNLDFGCSSSSLRPVWISLFSFLSPPFLRHSFLSLPLFQNFLLEMLFQT